MGRHGGASSTASKALQKIARAKRVPHSQVKQGMVLNRLQIRPVYVVSTATRKVKSRAGESLVQMLKRLHDGEGEEKRRLHKFGKGVVSRRRRLGKVPGG